MLPFGSRQMVQLLLASNGIGGSSWEIGSVRCCSVHGKERRFWKMSSDCKPRFGSEASSNVVNITLLLLSQLLLLLLSLYTIVIICYYHHDPCMTLFKILKR